MAIGIPGRTGSTRHTELGALNEIIKRLTDLRNAVNATGGPGSGDATEAEQQSQTALLTSIDGFVNSIDNIIAGQSTLVEQQLQTAELIDINVALNTANSPTHVDLTNPVNVTYSGFKELSFVCSGTISVVLDGNTIIYPKTLGAFEVLGSTIKADTSSLNAVTFNGTGSVLVTIKQ